MQPRIRLSYFLVPALLALPFAAAAVPQVWAGGDNTCAVVNGAAYCWGANTDGQVGNGTFTMATAPAAVQGLSSGVTTIVTSGAHSCAIVNGGAYCWGNNDYGQLGNNGSADSTAPVAVSGLSAGVTAIAVGDLHSCAVHNGAVKCWGSGGFGQLGTGGTIFSSAVPVAVSGLASGAVDVNAGKHHTCAITSAGAAFCWGRGDSGEMGNGTNTYISPAPVAVSGYGSGVGLVSTGAFFSCGIQGGAANCWGYGFSGRLGNGGTSNLNVPTAVVGLASGVDWISAGNGLHACALSAAGAQCWGGNNAGQLGIPGSPGGSTVPAAVQGLPGGIVDITAGGLHTCAATATAVYCWGDNANGQLGTGDQVSSSAPVLIFTVPPPPSNPPRLVNIATRGQVFTGDNVMIGGFAISGSSAKTVLILARGPSLADAGVPNTLPNPRVTLVSMNTGLIVDSNDDWGSAANAGAISATGKAPSRAVESAILITLNPGNYTAIVDGGPSLGTGNGIVEVYEMDQPETPLVNIATRGQVLTGDNVMIGGFAIGGDGPLQVLIVARGPSLADAGVPNTLPNPRVTLVSMNTGLIVASNDDWGTSGNAAAITATGKAPTRAVESAILITLDPGNYTAIVDGGPSLGTGNGIVEVYKQ